MFIKILFLDESCRGRDSVIEDDLWRDVYCWNIV